MKQILGRLNLHELDQPISQLSGGQLKRLALAHCLIEEPDLLLLDEPTAFLDLNHQIELCELISRLRDERQLTVVLVSHDLNLASQYCGRILLLDHGRVVRLGSPDDVIEPEVLAEVYGCRVLVDRHPESGLPRVTVPRRSVRSGN